MTCLSAGSGGLGQLVLALVGVRERGGSLGEREQSRENLIRLAPVGPYSSPSNAGSEAWQELRGRIDEASARASAACQSKGRWVPVS